jgi:hypothetical protein
VEATEQMALDNQKTFKELQEGLASSSKHIVASTSKLSQEVGLVPGWARFQQR